MIDGATWIAVALSIVSLLSVIGGWIAFVTKLKQELKAHMDMDDERFDTINQKMKDQTQRQDQQHRENIRRIEGQNRVLDEILRAVTATKEKGH